MTVTLPEPDPRVDEALDTVRLYVAELRSSAEGWEAIAQAEAERAAKAEADLAAHMLTHKPATLYGGCPPGGGTSLAAQQSVVDRWWVGAFVRQFMATGRAPRAEDAGRVHISWKPTLAQITRAWVESATANLLPGDYVEVWHELDRKVRLKALTKADGVARKNRFYDLVTEVRPDLLVVNTLTGQALSDYGDEEWQEWGVVKAHRLGLDADGIHDKRAPLDIPYEDEVDRVVRFLSANPSYGGWLVPEFGTSRPGWDTKGLERAAWATKYGRLFAAAGAEAVALYDYESTPGNQFKPGTPEDAAWHQFAPQAA